MEIDFTKFGIDDPKEENTEEKRDSNIIDSKNRKDLIFKQARKLLELHKKGIVTDVTERVEVEMSQSKGTIKTEAQAELMLEVMAKHTNMSPEDKKIVWDAIRNRKDIEKVAKAAKVLVKVRKELEGKSKKARTSAFKIPTAYILIAVLVIATQLAINVLLK